MLKASLDIASLRERYRAGGLKPTELIEELWPRLAAEDTHRIWIQRLAKEQILAYARALRGHGSEGLSALRRPVRHQGQHRPGGRADDGRLPGVRLHAAAQRRPWCSA